MAYTGKKEVYGMERKDNSKGPWLVFKSKDDKGEERTTNVFGSVVAEFCGGAINGKPVTGTYEITSEKEGKYWVVKSAKLLSPSGSAPTGTKTTTTTEVAGPRHLDPNVVRQNDSICAQVCVKAAAEVVAKAIENGGLRALKQGQTDLGSHNPIDMDEVCNWTEKIAGYLMARVERFVEGEAVPGGAPGTYVDGEGRTHEPVAEGA